jgi:phosphatidylserine decarboxylase
MQGSRRFRLPLAAEGWVFVLPPAICALIGALVGWWGLVALGVVLTGCMAAFFRDPERHILSLPGAVVAPADGRIMDIIESTGGRRISIFLSVLDVHINRAPCAGTVRAVVPRAGKFLAAYRREASAVNAATSVTLEHRGRTVVVTQIAGVLARRIVCRVQPGDVLQIGQRYGLIRFGSRTDVTLPPEAEVVAKVGDVVRGGETLLAILKEPHDL